MNVEVIARQGRIVLWFLIGYMVLATVIARYFLPHEVFLSLPGLGEYAEQELVLIQRPWTEAFHRLLGVTMLTMGMLQFNAGLRRHRPRLHRWAGRLFLSMALVVSATGLFIGFFYPFGGWEETINVLVAAALLLWFAGMGWIAIRRRRFAQHREWMIRALGLPFFVVLQRLYLLPVFLLTDWPQREAFVSAGWLALMTSLIAAECWINLTRASHPAAQVQRSFG